MKSRSLASYAGNYAHVDLHREDGVLVVRLHTDAAELTGGGGPHDELGWCFADIAGDPENEVVVLTGTGSTFCAHMNAADVDARPPEAWDAVHFHGKRLLTNLLDIPVPMIAAINGPATVHAELGLLCDVVLAADTAVFQDAPHYASGVVPGDGVHVIWPLLLGPNRGRYFLLTGETLAAQRALELGAPTGSSTPVIDAGSDVRAGQRGTRRGTVRCPRRIAVGPSASAHAPTRRARAAIAASRRRSSPQKRSGPTITVGTPNTPSDIA